MDEYSDDIQAEAKKIVQAKKGFYTHLGVYVIISGFLAVLNFLTYDQQGEVWFVIPMAAWGVGVAIHYLSVFGFPGSNILSKEWEAEELAREMRRLRAEKHGIFETESDEELPLDRLDLKVREKITRDRWNQEDIV